MTSSPQTHPTRVSILSTQLESFTLDSGSDGVDLLSFFDTNLSFVFYESNLLGILPHVSLKNEFSLSVRKFSPNFENIESDNSLCP